MDPLQHLATEARNPASSRLDELTSVEIVDVMLAEDATIPAVVATQRRAIAQAIDAIADRLFKGGRLIYIGAGTSGRLGVLDASECPPTFQSPPGQVVGLIAGGQSAMFQAVEGAEDSPDLGAKDLNAIKLSDRDVLVGIATSGRTPYVLGGVKHGNDVGAYTIAIVCTNDSELAPVAELTIAPIVGPEVVTGSTRLKAGTATKLVLNMLTTGAMVRLGKTFGNLMVDLKSSNQKLVARANRIVRTVTGLDMSAAETLLKACDSEVKTAIVSHLAKIDATQARTRLAESHGRVRLAIGNATPTDTAVVLDKRADLVLGIDGGGTNTTCILAEAATGKILGQATSGASNIQAVGVETGLKTLDDAIDRAFAAAGLPRSTLGAACLGLAGIDRQEGLEVIHGWAARVALADTVKVANDATLLLAAGTPDGWGLAVIAGTGSIAFVKTKDGKLGRCGGWGYLLGDEGSAYQLAINGLRAACRAHDQCGKTTSLVDTFLKKMNVDTPPELIPAVYRGPWDRTAIAGLAPLILDAAAVGDEVAMEIVTREANALAITAATAAKNSKLDAKPIPIALAGGLLLGSHVFREQFLLSLRSLGITADPIMSVSDPTAGAVIIARQALAAQV